MRFGGGSMRFGGGSMRFGGGSMRFAWWREHEVCMVEGA